MESLAVKYRPKKFEDVSSQSSVITILKRQLELCQYTNCYLFCGPSGCVSAETEFLTPTGWKKICDFNENDLVMQYNKDTEVGEFVKPTKFIKLPCNTLYHFKNTYGIDMVLSDEHRIVYKTYHKHKGVKKATYDWEETTCYEYRNRLVNNTNKQHYLVTTFKVDRPGIALSDVEIELMCAVICDGCFTKRNTNRCYLNLKKQHKIDRVIDILKRANIDYDITYKQNGYTLIKFYAPLKTKVFDSYWYNCNEHQLKVICDNILFWDGSGYEGRWSFAQKNKQTIDFVQYAFTVCNYRSTISCYKRKPRVKKYINVSGQCIEYKLDEELCYEVHVSKSKPSEIGFYDYPISSFKLSIDKVSTSDGYKYCFVVPSSMWVMRYNGRICITGNCGKTTLARIFANKINNGKGVPIEIDGASNNGVDNIRSIIEEARQRAIDSEYKVFIIDEVHSITQQGWQAFLKCLEEPPKYTIFILCTTNPEKIPATILNRVMRFNLSRIDTSLLTNRLEYICQQEGFINYKESCDYIAKMSNGGARDAIATLEKAASYSTDLKIENTLVALGTISYKSLFTIINSIIDSDNTTLFKTLESLYSQGQNLELLIGQLLDLSLNIEKYCIFQDINITNLPSTLKDELDNVSNISNNVDYYSKLSEKLLDIRNLLKNNTDVKSLVEVSLNRLVREGV